MDPSAIECTCGRARVLKLASGTLVDTEVVAEVGEVHRSVVLPEDVSFLAALRQATRDKFSSWPISRANVDGLVAFHATSRVGYVSRKKGLLMSLVDARKSLMSERRTLLDQVDLIDRAMAVLEGGTPAKARRNGSSKSKSKPKKTSRADLTQDQALERYGAEALTCTVCGRISRAPQGMKAHMRSHAS